MKKGFQSSKNFLLNIENRSLTLSGSIGEGILEDIGAFPSRKDLDFWVGRSNRRQEEDYETGDD